MLRARITLVAVTAVVAAIAVAIVTAYNGVAPLVAANFETGLSDRADTVAALLDSGGKIPASPDITEQVLTADGSVRQLTRDRAELPVSEEDLAVARAGHGRYAADVMVDGKAYGVVTRALPGGGAIMVGQNQDEVARIDNEFLWRTSWITALAVVAAAAFSWLLIGRILRPIRGLVDTTERITATGDLSARLPDAGRDEIGELTGNFNTMLAALRLSRAQQQRLVADAGHELRTPLTSIRGSAELLQRARGRLAPDDESRVLATLVHEAKALDTLVGELVDLSTDHDIAEPATTVDLAELAEDCAQRFRRRTGRAITVADTGPAPVRARPRALARCVDNLLDNALKYSPADTAVEVRLRGARLWVRDHGPGIDPAEPIFDRFYRADRTRSTPGSGLGLAIVHDIVTAHGGKVFATNHSGGGAEVGFELPTGAADLPT
ncbi:sensor histidine kinase [Nocardia pseudobrasiliensis]|uniref:histidine kinase n=1 Tax=Nocardia pseudobrasiliensis TaxID=45979 RepID=A0A370I1Q7_9NOCA|nr:HAMP domain-containing sensor histidine kinase [Nocardia pseudobrasiliensis]RDI64101.1 two-component system sensor histidine kinase MprB [Nocardia pseudobrasiliensis]